MFIAVLKSRNKNFKKASMRQKSLKRVGVENVEGSVPTLYDNKTFMDAL